MSIESTCLFFYTGLDLNVLSLSSLMFMNFRLLLSVSFDAAVESRLSLVIEFCQLFQFLDLRLDRNFHIIQDTAQTRFQKCNKLKTVQVNK